MTTERDELAGIIMRPESFDGGTISCGPGIVYATRIAEAIITAGYHKHRTVTTPEELDALPANSAILDHEGAPWLSDGDQTEPWASVCENPLGGPVWKDSGDIALPATVLYEGDQ